MLIWISPEPKTCSLQYKLLIATAKNSHFAKATELQELEAQPSHQVHINVVTFHEKSQ
jgi:hypothetical protein